MNAAASGTLSIAEVQSRLRLPQAVVNALLVSGLLGFWENGRVSEAAVESFEKFGTQWQPTEIRRYMPVSVAHTPINGEETPISTNLHIQISPYPEGHDASDKDDGWVAQFYLKPNRFFFPDPSGLSLTGPIGLQLKTAIEVQGTKKKTYLFPDPSGSLALLMIMSGGGSGPAQDAFNEAYDIAGPVLDELSFRHDYPLPVCQTLIVGVPSGVLTTFQSASPKSSEVRLALPRCEVPELMDATALYREGISSNSPFNQFLALWKSYENAVSIRSDWRLKVRGNRKDTRSDVYQYSEHFPKVFAFNGFEDLTFGQAKERLRTSHRNAVAHGTIEQGQPITASTAENVIKISGVVPIMRFMAYRTLANVRACLKS